jgi:hypothetical protein
MEVGAAIFVLGQQGGLFARILLIQECGMTGFLSWLQSIPKTARGARFRSLEGWLWHF